MDYDYEGRGENLEVNGTTYRIPKDDDTADAPLAFTDFANSIPFSEYIVTETVSVDTDIDDSYNGKMIVADASVTLTFGSLENGFSVACVADGEHTITYEGIDKGTETTDAYEVATVVRVNDKNIFSAARTTSNTPDCPDCPECPECPEPDPTPGAAVIGGATGAVTEYSTTDNGQAYDVYEFTGSGQLDVTTPGLVEAMLISGGGGGGAYAGGGGAAGGPYLVQLYLAETSVENQNSVTVGGGGNDQQIGESSRVANYYGNSGGSGAGIAAIVAQRGFCGGGGSGYANGNPGGIAQHPDGNNGGNGARVGNYAAGAGGGGAGAPGKNGTSNGAIGGTIPGDGGDGIDVSFFTGGPERWVCAGGAGGAMNGTGPAPGGKGGGGDGGYAGSIATATAKDGDENTGSGGGGSAVNVNDAPAGGKGGSGLAIIRVAVDTQSFDAKTRKTAPRTAHAARIEDGVVRQVIVIPHLDDDDTKITEYCNSIGLEGTWVDTSYTGSRRGKYAGVGDLFDPNLRNAEFKSPVMDEE